LQQPRRHVVVVDVFRDELELAHERFVVPARSFEHVEREPDDANLEARFVAHRYAPAVSRALSTGSSNHTFLPSVTRSAPQRAESVSTSAMPRPVAASVA